MALTDWIRLASGVLCICTIVVLLWFTIDMRRILKKMEENEGE